MYSILTIAQIVHGEVFGKTHSGVVKYLSVDSRGISGNDYTLFIALKGKNNNGHQFIKSLYHKNIRCFMVSEIPNTANFPDATFIKVNDTIAALQNIATYHRNQFNIPVLGITGSNGKTIVKEWLNYLISPEINCCRSPKSHNSQVGVPLSVWQLNNAADVACFEAGISEPQEMERLEKIIRPTIGLFTNLGDAHQESFSSLGEKLEEKMKLFLHSEVLLYKKTENDIIANYFNSKKNDRVLLSWGESANNDIQLKLTEKNQNKTTLHIEIHNSTFLPYFEDSKVTLNLPFEDNASIENCMNALLFTAYLSTTPLISKLSTIKTIKTRIKQLYPVNLRMEIIQGKSNAIILNDCYSNDIQGFSIALQQWVSIAEHRKKIIILSEFTHSGLTTPQWIRQLEEQLKSIQPNLFIGIGNSFFQNQINLPCQSFFYRTTADFLENANQFDFRETAILLKGERHFCFETVLPIFTKQTHLTTLEVNLTKALHNLNLYRQRLTSNSRILVLLKANAYGMGMVEIAKFLERQHIDYIGVAIADEGILLREQGITTPIIVLNPEPSAFTKMMIYKLEPEIYSLFLLREMKKAVRNFGEQHYPIHLKLDTGMHRLGFSPEDIPELQEEITRQNQVSIHSIFSHFAAADEKDKSNFSLRQLSLFQSITNELNKHISPKAKLHIANSAAISQLPQSHFDIVRLGIGFYGYTDIPDIQPIATLRSTIIQIRKIPAGDPVGYGCASIVKRPSTIGVVPIGYADGLNRKLSNGKGYFTVHKQHAPIIGNICMDLCMIDLTDIQAKEGDPVIIFGNVPTVADIAKQLDTIPYEILCSVSERVKRIHFTE